MGWADLDGACRRVLGDAKRAEAPDLIRHADFGHAWPDIGSELQGRLDSGTYLPARPRIVDLPKDAYALRPLALLEPEDLVAYEAACAVAAPSIDSALPDNVFSARLRTKGDGLTQRDQRAEWIRFQRRGVRLHNQMPLALMLTTDVTSYFEYVDIRTLLDDLTSFPGLAGPAVDFLRRFLNELNRISDVWGLPQGPSMSSVLGNLYLLSLDRLLLLHPVRYIRFQDDIKVFGDNRAELRIALKDVIQHLRARHLSLSVHKTKILEGDEIAREFEDSRKAAISYGIAIGDPSSKVQLHDMFDEAIASTPINARDVRYTVYRLGNLGDPYALSWILTNLDNVPYLAALLVRYLGLFVKGQPSIEDSIRDYLAAPSRNLYPYVEMQFIRFLSLQPHIEDSTQVLVLRMVADDSKDDYVREHAARCAGRHARAGDASLLRTDFGSTSSTKLRRALMIALWEAGAADKAWLNSVRSTDPLLDRMASYLLSSPKLPPP